MKILYIILIALLTILVWQNTLKQTFLGEGYYYFEPQQNLVTPTGINMSTIWELDNFAKFMFDILPPIFRDNISYYFGFQIFVLILLNITVFALVKFATKKTILSFTATVLFLASYVGLFEMIGAGNYQRFAQRVPNLIPTLWASFFLIKFLDTNKFKYYFLSISLFSFSVFIAHFTTFLLPFFVIYTLLWTAFTKNNLPKILKYLAVASSFILANALVISRDSHTPSANILAFIEDRGILPLLQQILLQHANIVLPTQLIEKVASIANPYTDMLIILSLPVILLYLLGIFLIRKENLKFRMFYLSCLVAVPVLLFLNLYLGKVDAAYNIKGYTYYFIPSYFTEQVSEDLQIKGDRAYMVPSIFVAVIWAYLIWAILSKKKKLYLALTCIVITIYTLNNIRLINHNIDVIQFNSEIMKNYISYTKSISNTFNEKTIIVTPQPLLWPSAFVRSFYGNPNMRFISANQKWEDEIKGMSKENIMLLDFDYKNNKVVDLTSKFRSGEEIVFQGF